MKLTQLKTPAERQKYLERKLKIKLTYINKAFVNNSDNIHCENLIGETTIPLGVVGPLRIKSNHLKNEYYIPLATTEGALVASVNRGCKAINLSDGVNTFIEEVGATRGPVFETGSINNGFILKKWLDKNFSLLAKTAEKTSSYIKLRKIKTEIVGKYAFVRFYFNTGEAMGMNMVTIATDRITKLIGERTKMFCLSLSGNFCIDKKPAWLNFISGRGKRSWAEVILSERVLKEILKTTAKKMEDVWLSKCIIGSIMSGSMGFNSHFANIVAAFFAATGQDLAHVVEGSLGITIVRALDNGDLYCSVYLPAIMIGTIGGGTKLKIKKEALSIIGLNNSSQLAEVLTAVVLAGEISLLASLEEGSLVKAHKKLGR